MRYLILVLLLAGCVPAASGTEKSHNAQISHPLQARGPASDAEESSRSAGCDQPPPASSVTSLSVAGRNRTLIAAVPEGYTATTPQRLVIAFHGRTSSNAEVRRYFGLEHSPQAQTESTIFLYPSGLRSGDHYSWSDPGDPANALRDYAFFDALLRTYARAYCLDLSEVYVVGHSLGAWFANSLACARGEQIRGAATLGGSVSGQNCQGDVAAMLLHNPDDGLVPISRGRAARDLYLLQNELTDLRPTASEPHAFNCQRYGAANETNPVLWCPHPFDLSYSGRYYPHNWPPGTGQVIMAFFNSL